MLETETTRDFGYGRPYTWFVELGTPSFVQSVAAKACCGANAQDEILPATAA